MQLQQPQEQQASSRGSDSLDDRSWFGLSLLCLSESRAWSCPQRADSGRRITLLNSAARTQQPQQPPASPQSQHSAVTMAATIAQADPRWRQSLAAPPPLSRDRDASHGTGELGPRAPWVSHMHALSAQTRATRNDWISTMDRAHQGLSDASSLPTSAQQSRRRSSAVARAGTSVHRFCKGRHRRALLEAIE